MLRRGFPRPPEGKGRQEPPIGLVRRFAELSREGGQIRLNGRIHVGKGDTSLGPLGSRCVPVVRTRQPYVLKDAACVGEQDLVRQYLQAATAGRRDGMRTELERELLYRRRQFGDTAAHGLDVAAVAVGVGPSAGSTARACEFLPVPRYVAHSRDRRRKPVLAADVRAGIGR